MQTRQAALAAILSFLPVGLVFACGASGDAAMASDFEPPSGNGGGGGMPTTTWTDTTTTTPPPEQEVESSFGAPVATGKYVWVANPTSGRVAYINAATLEIKVVDAGNGPTELAAVPDPKDDVAVVLNVLSLDATVLRASAGGALSAKSFAVPAAGNRWAIAPEGRWATAWSDARGIEDPDPFDGYQDISVLDLKNDTSTPLSVGYRPVTLGYDDEGTRLFAVTEDGITVVALDGVEPVVVKNVPLSDDPFEDTSTRDVAITPDGAYALVRRDGDATVYVFSLATGARTEVVLSAPVTDMDLAPDGSVAVAVVRDTSEVALLRIPAIASDPEAKSVFKVGSTTVGSVALAADSSIAFLYTNAVASEVLTVFNAADLVPDPRSIVLHAPVKAVFPTADASHAIVLHDNVGSSQGTSYPAAVSLVPVAAQLPSKIVGLEQSLVSLAISPSGDRALLATGLETDTEYQMVVAKLPSLKVDTYALASRPISAGIVAGANRGFVAQHHPDGRISFVDLDDGEVRTLTGFELATQVVDGSKP